MASLGEEIPAALGTGRGEYQQPFEGDIQGMRGSGNATAITAALPAVQRFDQPPESQRQFAAGAGNTVGPVVHVHQAGN